MRLPRPALALLALILAGPALISAQDQPLAAGSEGVPVPKKKKHVQPVYPPDALAQGIRGIVILDLVIDTEGKVAEVRIVRSIAGLDEAALVAARQWRYEPVEVDGRPVSVRLTVPITFALKLPEVSRDRGIPELRQGVTPAWPENARGGGDVMADVTLDPDGRIGLARIIEGQEEQLAFDHQIRGGAVGVAMRTAVVVRRAGDEHLLHAGGRGRVHADAVRMTRR